MNMELSVFDQYFNELVLSESIKNRIQDIATNISLLYTGIEFSDIFLNNITNSGILEFTSLWLFSENYVVECKNFINEDDFDLTVLNKNVLYFNVKKSDYDDWENPTACSRVVFNMLVNNGKLSCNLNASGVNCKYAFKIVQKCFLRNMISVR